MHAHSFLWWMGAVFAARWLFRTCLPLKAAGIATVIFALAPCHVIPLAWLANRESLISLTLGVVGLVAAIRWQRGAGLGMGFLSIAAFSLALAAGEYAVACGGYLLMFGWWAPARKRRRVGMVLFFAIPVAGYLACRRVFGYGATGSGFYQDPLRDTGLYLTHAPWRFVSLTLQGWFSQDTTYWQWGPSLVPVVLALGVQGLLLRPAIKHTLSQLSEEHRRNTMSFFWGSFIAILPVLAVEPSARLLGVAMLGISAVLGTVLGMAWFGSPTEARHGIAEWTAIVATLLGFAHMIHGPGTSWLSGRQMRGYATEFKAHAHAMADKLRGHPDAHVVIVRGLDDVFFYGFAIDTFDVPSPRWTVLSHTGHILTLRKDTETLEIVVGADTALYPATLGDLYRGELDPLLEGSIVPGDGFVATVAEATLRGPRRVRFRFDRDLDDPNFVWVGESRGRGFIDATPPKIGFGSPQDP
jgi:hypothetical protein